MFFNGTCVFIGSLQGSKTPTAASKKLDFLLKTYIKILPFEHNEEKILSNLVLTKRKCWIYPFKKTES